MSVMTSSGGDVSTKIRPREPIEAREPVPEKRPLRPASSKTVGRTLPVVPPVVLALVLLLAWYLGTAYGGIPSLIIPAPKDVLGSLVNGLSSGLFLNNTWVTVQESLLGFLLAAAVALPMGYGLAKSRLLAATIQPYLAAGQAIPAIVIAPLLVMWLGYGLLPIVILCALVVLFPMVVTTALGIVTIDREIIDAAHVEGASGWSLLAAIEFPLALPAILAGVRTSLTLSITGALVGEFVNGGGQGLGGLVLVAKDQYDTAGMFATLVVLAVLAALYYGISWLLIKLADFFVGA